MKITNMGIVNTINILQGFLEKKLPQKISYAITRNYLIIQKDYECYSESLNKLFAQYNEHIVKDESGNVMSNDNGVPIVDSEVSEEFNKEISTLLNIEIEVNLYQIPEEVFDYDDTDKRYDSLSAVDIMNLQTILCNQNNDEKE